MDNGSVKVRRRTTGVHRVAQVSVTLEADQYDVFMDWFRVSCRNGIKPTNIFEPTGIESVWRFIEPPQISWAEPQIRAFTASCKLERLPSWQVV